MKRIRGWPGITGFCVGLGIVIKALEHCSLSTNLNVLCLYSKSQQQVQGRSLKRRFEANSSVPPSSLLDRTTSNTLVMSNQKGFFVTMRRPFSTSLPYIGARSLSACGQEHSRLRCTQVLKHSFRPWKIQPSTAIKQSGQLGSSAAFKQLTFTVFSGSCSYRTYGDTRVEDCRAISRLCVAKRA